MHILLMYSTHAPSAGHIRRLQEFDPAIRVTVADQLEAAVREAPTAEIIFGHRYLSQCLPIAEQLRWVQSTASGIDRLPLRALARKGIRLSAMQTFAPVIARHAITLAWAITRCLPQAFERQLSGTWDDNFAWLPWPRRAFILGAGKIGSELAGMLAADGFEVAGARRTTTGLPASSGFTHLYDKSSWREALATSDWCFLALPHTEETHALFDEAALRTLPSHAVLVNIGRGETLDTTALRRVLSEGHLGGAALDVIHPKPGGPDDPIWKTPRLLITPHCAAHHRERADAIERFCEAQLERYLAGLPVLNLVELENFRNNRGFAP